MLSSYLCCLEIRYSSWKQSSFHQIHGCLVYQMTNVANDDILAKSGHFVATRKLTLSGCTSPAFCRCPMMIISPNIHGTGICTVYTFKPLKSTIHGSVNIPFVQWMVWDLHHFFFESFQISTPLLGGSSHLVSG